MLVCGGVTTGGRLMLVAAGRRREGLCGHVVKHVVYGVCGHTCGQRCVWSGGRRGRCMWSAPSTAPATWTCAFRNHPRRDAGWDQPRGTPPPHPRHSGQILNACINLISVDPAPPESAAFLNLLISRHPAPYTLHPIPYTLYPILYTLYPAPYTLYPIPYALHPEP